MTTLELAFSMVPGATLVGDGRVGFSRVHTDTRTLRDGDLFVALRGDRFDGHDFLAQAKAAGAVAALAERGLQEAALPGLQVQDSLSALQALAAAWRRLYAGPLVAVTGSNGKTTVTQMVAAILRSWVGDAALATAGNLNNHIGVPLTLLRIRPQGADAHRAAVVELGMNHPGEIAQLAAMAEPTVALVNNAQREHQEFMASVEAVARENGSVIEALGPAGVAVFPADDTFAPLWRELAGTRRAMTFGLESPADVRGRAAWRGDGWSVEADTPAGALRFTLRLAGRHNVLNALAAAACAIAAGAPLEAVARGLETFEPVAGRSRLLRIERAGAPVTLVDDSYNANPDSVLAAVEMLAALPPARWLVLGDMGEVGERGPEFHAEVGARARERGVEHLWCAGALMSHAARAYGGAARHFDTVDALLAALPQAPVAASVLVKGSRFMKMERVVQALQTPQSALGGI
jgi:UDP-N-acetylmuramoyl-tripeptide--D-alanyl-D-alanine ligase